MHKVWNQRKIKLRENVNLSDSPVADSFSVRHQGVTVDPPAEAPPGGHPLSDYLRQGERNTCRSRRWIYVRGSGYTWLGGGVGGGGGGVVAWRR